MYGSESSKLYKYNGKRAVEKNLINEKFIKKD